MRSARVNHVQHSKPFITTVKSGEFLLPPRDIATLLCITSNANSGNSNTQGSNNIVSPFCRLRLHQEQRSLNRRPEVHNQMHSIRCQMTLKATENFHIGRSKSVFTLMNSRKSVKKNLTQTFFDVTPRALPQKLDPIEGTMKLLPNPWDHPPPFGNLNFNRRIMRGSIFTSTPTLIDCEKSPTASQAEVKRRQIIRKRYKLQTTKATLVRIGTPPPMTGRKHEPVQTELFLEELFEKPEESEVAVQTDYFLYRPVSPPYCPSKADQDASTQIEPGDLFDYDLEVQPILEVLVGKTIEQALIEVLEEEEMATLREQQRKFLELRAAEKAEQQRLEEQDRRIRQEKNRRIKQHVETVKMQQETEERVAAAVLLTGYIAELLPAVLEGLKISGFLLDEIKADVEEEFMPWLMKEVKKEMGTMIQSRAILQELVSRIIKNRAVIYTRLGDEYDASRKSKVESLENICEKESVANISSNDNENYISSEEKKQQLYIISV